MKEKLDQILLAISNYEVENDLNEAHLGNILSFIHETFGKDSWVGIYRLKNDKLILSSFQGTPACEIIQIGHGVVGTSFKEEKVVFANDVSTIKNYICCDPIAKSEICLPLFSKQKIIAILDIDLPFVHNYRDEIKSFEKIARIVEKFLD